MTSTCGHCGEPLAPATTGRPKAYCDDRCRNAAREARAATRGRAEHLPTSAPETRQRPSWTGKRQLCPVDPGHGAVLDWPTSRWGFRCGHADHDGRPKAHPLGPSEPTRSFFRSSEVEAGALEFTDPVSLEEAGGGFSARPPLRGPSDPAAAPMPGQRGDVQLPLMSG